ncbi:MAG: DUF2723 domain-containing protein [Caldilineae bacterium]|nr:MAG: DUF2723 domain-containing protein [Caldilineae bacterium]
MSSLRDRLWPLLVMAAGGVVYLLTLAPTVTGTDAGELVLAAYGAGVAHAPGFPTWLWLAWPVSHLPFAEPARLLNGLSALLATLTLPVLWLWLRLLMAPASVLSRPLSPQGMLADGHPVRRGAALPAAVALTFAVGRSFWVWANTTEVYALNTLLVAVSLYGFFRWYLAPDEHSSRGWLRAAAASYGLALGAHLATTALLAPAFALALYRRRHHLDRRLFFASALMLCLGLGAYAWLPWRAAQDPLLNWGDPDNLRRFWRHVSAAQYRSNIDLRPQSLLSELRFAMSLLFWQYSPLGLPLMAWGLWWGRKHRPRILEFLLVGIASGTAYALAYAIEDDQDAYYLLVHLLLLVPLMWGAQHAVQCLADRFRSQRWIVASLFLLPALTLLSNVGVADRSDYWYHRDYYRNLTAEVAQGGTIFTRDWQFYSPSLYYRYVMGERADLRVIDVELMRRDWYLDSLERRYPELTTAAQPALQHYRALRDEWEADPTRFEQNPQAVAALQDASIAAINALIATAKHLGPVHLGLHMEPGVGAGYTWIPAGLTFRLEDPSRPMPTLAGLSWQLEHLRGRWDRLPDEPARKVARVHALMLINRALYLAELGEKEAALAALDLAEQIVPADALTQQVRAQIEGG